MHIPISHVLMIVALISAGSAFAGLTQAQGRNALIAAAEADAVSSAVVVASACASAAEDAKIRSAPASVTVTFNKPVTISAGGKTVSATITSQAGPASATVTLGANINVNIAPFSKPVRWVNVTAQPDGSITLSG